MWSTEILDQCAIIRLEDRFPRMVKVPGREITLDRTFFFTSFDGGKMFTYRNLGIHLSEIDKTNLAKEPEFEKGRMNLIGDSIIRMRVDDYFIGTLSRINELKGCRVNPNILSYSQDAYIQIEFSSSVRESVSKLLLEALPALPAKGELIYMGRQPEDLPYLMKLFTEAGGSINDFFFIKTEWHMNKENREKENSGVFLNEGKFIPKYFTSEKNNILIFRNKMPDFKGKSGVNVIDNDTNLVELGTETNFFMDFYKEVVQTYYGTLFYEVEVNGDILTNYYVIDRKLSSLFLAGQENHWKMPVRKDHYNVVVAAMSLGAIYK